MKRKPSVIEMTDLLTLVTVWELQEGYWELVTITRLKRAITLAQESPLTRLVFPTEIKPDGVWGGIYKNRSAKINPNKVDSLQKRRERVLALLKNSPGQTRFALAEQLGVSVATVGQLLRKLEKNGDTHHRPHPMQNKTKLYYAGTVPNTIGTSANKSTSKALPRLGRELPLKAYFIEPKTLQPLNQ